MQRAQVDALLARYKERSIVVAVIGLGYVGLPLVRALLGAGYEVIGLDIDPEKISALKNGHSYIHHVPSQPFTAAAASGQFHPSTGFASLGRADAVIICVPTPLSRNREPDLSYVEATTRAIATHLRPAQLVVLESTTYPGTTRDVMRPILEAGGLKSGEDFFLAYSPEREDPGNNEFQTSAIPRVVGGDGPAALALAQTLYASFVPKTVPVSSLEIAEAVKLTENIFRAVNIALVNELKIIYEAMGIDVWEVIEAAKSKPFGYMPFYPGPGLGGHCIPIDPFYLSWKTREFELSTHFIELAGEVNTNMPRHVVARVGEELNRRYKRSLNGSRVLIVGLAYKKNVDDTRESPSLKLIELMEKQGATCDIHDPYIAVVPPLREHPSLVGRKTVALNAEMIETYDVVLIATDHDNVDYRMLVKSAKLVVDTRNACAKAGITGANIAKA